MPVFYFLSLNSNILNFAYFFALKNHRNHILWLVNWLRPTLPGPCGPSTIGDEELNCCVRDGNRCILFSIIAILVFFNNLEFSIIFIDEININKFLILCQYINFSQILTFLYSVCTLKTAYHNPKLGQVLDLLVLLS